MKKTAKEYDRLELIREMEKTLPYKRFIHTMGVAAVAAGLAMRHGEDVHRTEVAGILHDCAKNIKQRLTEYSCGFVPEDPFDEGDSSIEDIIKGIKN